MKTETIPYVLDNNTQSKLDIKIPKGYFAQKNITKAQIRKRKESETSLRKIRLKSGKTLSHLAEKIDMSPSYLSRIEAGERRLNEDLIFKLSKALNCSPSELLNPWTKTRTNSNERGKKGGERKTSIPVFDIKISRPGEPFNIHPTNKKIAPPFQIKNPNETFAFYLEKSPWKPNFSDGDILFFDPKMELHNGLSILVKHIEGFFIGTYIHSETPRSEFIFITSFDEQVKKIVCSRNDVEIYGLAHTAQTKRDH